MTAWRQKCISREERIDAFGCTLKKDITSDSDVFVTMASMRLVQGRCGPYESDLVGVHISNPVRSEPLSEVQAYPSSNLKWTLITGFSWRSRSLHYYFIFLASWVLIVIN
jgi:hypothetical protein